MPDERLQNARETLESEYEGEGRFVQCSADLSAVRHVPGTPDWCD